MKILVVVDMQNDFITGALGTKEAQAIVPKIQQKIDQCRKEDNSPDRNNSIELVGVCTGICVLSNAVLIKSMLPEIPIVVDASCCACVTPESHKTALEAMKLLQIEVINE